MIDVVCLHGLGGTSDTVAPIADALRRDGWEVAAPLLPGHGTQPEDLIGVTWAQWVAAIPRARVVIGQSLGGSLALAAAARGGATSGVVCINALGYSDPDAIEALEAQLARGGTWVDAGPPDIRAEGVGEAAYDRLPVDALLEMAQGVDTVDLAVITVPVLVVTSADDAILDPYHSDVIASSVSGQVERLLLPRSGHVATLDHDAPLLVQRVREWIARRLA